MGTSRTATRLAKRAPYRGRELFEKDLLENVVPMVESNYRVQADPQHRGIVGLSMGGGQSISVGLGHLDQFAWVGAFSAGISGQDSVPASLRSDPNAANQKLKLFWIGIGKDDFLRLGTGSSSRPWRA